MLGPWRRGGGGGHINDSLLGKGAQDTFSC